MVQGLAICWLRKVTTLPNQGLDLAILPVFSSIVIGKESFMIHLVLIIGKNAQAKSSDVINHRYWPRISHLGFKQDTA